MTTSPPFHHATLTGTHAHLAECGQGRGALTYLATWERACSYCLGNWQAKGRWVKVLLKSGQPDHRDMVERSVLALFDREGGTSPHEERRLRAMGVIVRLLEEAAK